MGLGTIASTMRRRVGWAIRDRFPRRRVVRQVQGVELVLPWSHRLPDYAAGGPQYGQNLVELAQLLAAGGPLTVLDVGANVGDSAVQILNAADGKVLCVEADSAYLDFLHRNVDDDERVTVVEALLTLGEGGSGRTAVRTGGTTRFVQGAQQETTGVVTPGELRARHPAFADLRLVKSDTDGYDTTLVPAIAQEWSHATPVLFFEYDPYLTRLAGHDAAEVWARLADLGYVDVAVWDHGGSPLGRSTILTIGGPAAALAAQRTARPQSRTYWDVAVVHADDVVGRRALDALVTTGIT